MSIYLFKLKQTYLRYSPFYKESVSNLCQYREKDIFYTIDFKSKA